MAKDSLIKVSRHDKGNGIVILDSEDYFSKLDVIIANTTKFEEIIDPSQKHPIIKNEDSIDYYCRTYLKKNVPLEDYPSVAPSGSQPGRLYGQAKVHKEGSPLRPVVSMFLTAEYGLAKWLDSIIKPHIFTKYVLSSTTDFIAKLKSYVSSPTDVICSFDVVSLFTNVPLSETTKAKKK